MNSRCVALCNCGQLVCVRWLSMWRIVYRVDEPRAVVLESASSSLEGVPLSFGAACVRLSNFLLA